MMYRPDTVLSAGEKMLKEHVSEALSLQIREDLKHYDWQNGALHGLHEVFDLLRDGSWPATAKERDELCRRWECSARSLYQWRRDVLFCVVAAVMETWVIEGLPTRLPT